MGQDQMSNNEHQHCHSEPNSSSCHHDDSRIDYLLWCSAAGVTGLYVFALLFEGQKEVPIWLQTLSSSTFELINMMWWGLLIGIFALSLLTRIPREFVMSALGSQRGLPGIVRATIAGVLLDLCSHGILMVGAKLYQRGATLGQTVAFLVASPWNSFSLTLVLVALIGIQWTLIFIGLSLVIAIISGIIFDLLVRNKLLPENPNTFDLPNDFKFWHEAKSQFTKARFNRSFFISMIIDGLKESRMVMRWILFGVLLASSIRIVMSPDHFNTFFGPDLLGLGATLLVATVLEVCSEGSTPIAADLLNRAQAPGNSFAFLMTGVATDYTEIMVMKSTTQSWKIALFIPLITVPQVIFIAWIINSF